MPKELRVNPATPSDAAEVLVLQRCCWATEAIINSDLGIPALSEPLAEVQAWLPRAWVIRDGARLIGAVRAHRDGDTWQIGRLMVAPDRQGQGIGRRLLAHAESQAPAGTVSFELFTGALSQRNLELYRRAGYQEVDRVDGLVYLRKPRELA